MKKMVLAGTIVLLVLTLTGCAPSYRIGDETFDSSSAALQRQTQLHAGMLAQISESKNPIGGNVLVAIPSDSEFRKNYVLRQLDPQLHHRISQDLLDYISTLWRNNEQFQANAIAKRRLFNSVAIANHNGSPASFPIGDNDFLIYLDIDGWFIKSKNKSPSLSIPVDKDKKLSVIQRTEAFLDDLYKQAQTLQGK